MNEKTIFISYAHEDIEVARKLYQDLKQKGFSPWLDKESILPGQRWKVAIKKAIRQCRYFIALLSSNSVTRKGYVHQEMTGALEVLEMFPESYVFLIPVRLDDCEPSHEKLRDLQWVDMFPSWNDGFDKIISVLIQDSERHIGYQEEPNRPLDIVTLKAHSNKNQIVSLVAHWPDEEGYKHAVFSTGKYTYYGGSIMNILDTSYSKSPKLIGTFDVSLLSRYCSSICVLNNYAYIVGSQGLTIIDVSDPYDPLKLSFFYASGEDRAVTVNGNYAYVASWHKGLRIIDISDKKNPFEIGYLNKYGFAIDVALSNDYAYVAENNAGLRIVNISNPENPQEVTLINPSNVNHLALNGNYVYIAGDNKLHNVDISNPKKPTISSLLNYKGGVSGMAADNNYVYLAISDEEVGLHVIDVSNSKNPYQIGRFDTRKDACDVAINENYIYIIAENGLYILQNNLFERK